MQRKTHTMTMKTAKLLLACLLGTVFLNNVNAQSLTDSAQAARQRIATKVERVITAKVQRVKDGMQKWAASGRDPSAIGKP